MSAQESEEPAVQRCRTLFRAHHDRAPDVVVRSPGRVNLVGDHTDYNDGLAMPLAIDRELCMAVGARGDGVVRLWSELDAHTHRHALDTVHAERKWDQWPLYVQAMLRQVPASWLTGFDAVVTSDLAGGAGLASSAALEMAVARAVAALADQPHDPRAAANWGVQAENSWVGVSTGVLDQLAVACGQDGHAMVLDCNDLSIEPVALPGNVEVVILDTGARRTLVGSAYDDRRRACDRAAARLGVVTLRDVDDLGEVEAPLADRVLARRVRHVVTESRRVREVAAALAAGDPESAGAAMSASHASLRDDYDVSGPELDMMAALANDTPGVLGARMTGGGFAGAVVALARPGEVDLAGLVGAFRRVHDLPANALRVRPVSGTSTVSATGA